MMRFGCGAHVMGHGHHGAKSSDDQSGDRNLRLMPSNQGVDPVCGMTVQTNTAKSAVHNGRAYYFCSEDCRQKFEAAPTSYVKAAAA
jgi:YHS domain-containing protein